MITSLAKQQERKKNRVLIQFSSKEKKKRFQTHSANKERKNCIEIFPFY